MNGSLLFFFILSKDSHHISCRHKERINIFKSIEFSLIDSINDGTEMIIDKKIKREVPESWSPIMYLDNKKIITNTRQTLEKLSNGSNKTYLSSGVSWTGSSVNSGGKLAKSRSDSNLGLYGGVTCFCSSCEQGRKRNT